MSDPSAVSVAHDNSSLSTVMTKNVQKWWNAYLQELVTNPVRTKSATSAFCSIISTLLAQRTLGVPLSQINWTSVRHQALLGAIRGPIIHYWMILLERIFRRLGYKTAAEQAKPEIVVGKMALDQLLFAPAHLLYYMHALGWLEGKPFAATQAKVAAEFFPLLKLNWCLWPAVALINYKFVPPALRSAFLNLIGIGWTLILVKAMAKQLPAPTPAVAVISPAAADAAVRAAIANGQQQPAASGVLVVQIKSVTSE